MPRGSRDWNLTDELVAAARNNDPIAIDDLLRRATPGIRDLAFVRLAARPGRFHSVEEIVQETTRAIAASIARLSEPTVARFKAFVHGVVAHKVIDHVDRAKRVLPLVDDLRAVGGAMSDLETRTGLFEMFGDVTSGPATKVARAELIGHVVLAVARLGHDHREVIELTFFCGLDTAEIGDQLGIERSTAAMRLLRAIRALKREIRSELGESHAEA